MMALTATATHAQDAQPRKHLSGRDPLPIRPGEVYTGALPPSGVHAYALDLAADRFVYGEANQMNVDVVVTVVAPGGQVVSTFDGSGQGAEPFQFATREAGRYRVEVRPFEVAQADEAGGPYALTVRRVEPVATTPEGRVDQLMAAYDTDHTPGGVIAVVQEGALLFARGYGMADLEQGVPNTPETPYKVASVSKQFTAFAITKLAEEGRLSLNDDVRTYLPEVPDFGATITLHHLLTHTSGLRDQWGLWIMAGGRLDDVVRQSDIMRLVERQRELNYAPGTEYLYNNTGYHLLARVVERVTGESYGAWMQQHVFEPMGMASSQIVDRHERLIEKRAYSYRQGDDGIEKAVLNFATYGPTGLATTATDLARWLHNYRPADTQAYRIIERMQQERAVLSTGDTLNYGLGLALLEQRGLTRINHFGIDAGYRVALSYYPEIDAGVVLLANTASFPFFKVSNEVAEIFFEAAMTEQADDRAEAEPETEHAGPVAPSQLEDYVGTYAVGEGPGVRLNRHPYEGPYAVDGGPTVRFVREDSHLVAHAGNQPPVRLIAVADTLFRFDVPTADIRVGFRRDSRGRVEGGAFFQYGTTPFRRVEPWSPDAKALGAYTGQYYSPELETVYTASVEEGHLVLQHRRHDPVILTPAAEEGTFQGSGQFASVHFERAEAGVVTEMLVSYGRGRNIRFEKRTPATFTPSD